MTIQTGLSLDELRSHLKQTQPDFYFATLFAPRHTHTHLMVLYSLNQELSRIKYQVNEPMAGRIRLQWWWDIVQSLMTQGPDKAPQLPPHPLSNYLIDLARVINLNPFLGMIESYENALDKTYLKHHANRRVYCDTVMKPLLHMATQITGENQDGQAVARSIGLMQLCRSAEKEISHGFESVPHNDNDWAELLNDVQPYPCMGHIGVLADLTQIYKKRLIKNKYDAVSLSFSRGRPVGTELIIALRHIRLLF